MPREKECFRDMLQRLDAAFPSKEFLNQKEAAEFTGRDPRTIRNNFGKFFKPGLGISKVQLARLLS